jgi:hypothetical protein
VRTASIVLWAVLIAVPALGQTRKEQWQVGTSPSFSSGRYGTGSRTEIFHTPITARRLFADGDLTLVLPFTCIRGDGSVTVVNGTPVRRDSTGTRETTTGSSTRGTSVPAGRDGSGSTRSNGAPTAAATPEPLTVVTSHCGMGDVVVRGRYFIVDEGPRTPTIALRGHLKAPTADADAGLGTGRADEGFGIEVSRTVGGIVMMADGGYTFVGEPAGVEYRNTWWWDAGLGQDFAGGTVNLSVFLESYQAIVPGLVDARDILAALTVSGASGWRLQVSAEFGLSDGAPDHGFAVGASRRF